MAGTWCLGASSRPPSADAFVEDQSINASAACAPTGTPRRTRQRSSAIIKSSAPHASSGRDLGRGSNSSRPPFADAFVGETEKPTPVRNSGTGTPRQTTPSKHSAQPCRRSTMLVCFRGTHHGETLIVAGTWDLGLPHPGHSPPMLSLVDRCQRQWVGA